MLYTADSMRRFMLYTPVLFLIVPMGIYLLLQFFTESAEADSFMSCLIVLSVFAALLVLLIKNRLPDSTQFKPSQYALLLFGGIVIASAIASHSYLYSLYGFAFDMTSIVFLLTLILSVLLLGLLEDPLRRLFCVAAGVFLLIVVSLPYLGETSHIRPSFMVTASIETNKLSENGPRAFFLGSGPGSFIYVWQKYRPSEVNETPFWNEDFPVGGGVIPTLCIEIGVVGVFLLMLAFLLAVFEECSSLFYWRKFSHRELSWRLLSLFLPLLALCALFFAEPSALLLSLSFVILGSFRSAPEKVIHTHSSVRTATMVAVSLCMLTVVYVFCSVALYFSAYDRASAEDLVAAHTRIQLAYGMTRNPQTGRLFVQTLRAEGHALAQHKNTSPSALFNEASRIARNIAVREPKNAQNVKLLGISLAEEYAIKEQPNLLIEGKEAFKRARTLSPSDPSILYFHAQLLILGGDREEAKKTLESAMTLRPSYIEAQDLLNGLQGK